MVRRRRTFAFHRCDFSIQMMKGCILVVKLLDYVSSVIRNVNSFSVASFHCKILAYFIHEISLSFIVNFIHQWVHSLFYIPRFLAFVKSTSCPCHYLFVITVVYEQQHTRTWETYQGICSQDKHKPKHINSM